jgi:hypothetical protein
MKKTLAAAAVMLVALVACAPSDVNASDYDQSCAKDDDCVAVSELHTRGTDCIFSCDAKAINAKDKAQFDEDVRDEERHCGAMASPFCDVSGVPRCVQGRCEIKPE